MRDETLVADLIRAGVAPDLVGRVANALVVASADVGRRTADAVAERRRNSDREYQRKRREILAKAREDAKANDVAPRPEPSADASADSADVHCNLTSFSSSDFQRSKERKKGEQAKRGTRMVAGTPLPEPWRGYARDQGFADTQTEAIYGEFVDFWIAVPGQRGMKLDWFATFRNRLRQVGNRKGNGNGRSGSVLDAFDRLERQLASGDDHPAGENGVLRLPAR